MAKWTKWIIIGVTLALILWDIFVYVEPTDNDTLSHVIMTWAGKHPMIVLGAGVLVGHWFWPQYREPE